jgi:hypothetical protein
MKIAAGTFDDQTQFGETIVVRSAQSTIKTESNLFKIPDNFDLKNPGFSSNSSTNEVSTDSQEFINIGDVNEKTQESIAPPYILQTDRSSKSGKKKDSVLRQLAAKFGSKSRKKETYSVDASTGKTAEIIIPSETGDGALSVTSNDIKGALNEVYIFSPKNFGRLFFSYS